ncbi:MAG TPA: DUF1963 domain-containing protein [Polyangiaceae bacterium]|nr:DUF1963 domain-containing protein [Polyangiaceae bacterium]HMR78995.1 DUF1963 domain-containing protein [Polyangiaceae bacterium]
MTLPASIEQLLADAIAHHGLTSYSAEIQALARATVLLGVEPQAELPVGTSKLGGTPDLPNTLTWPTNGDDKLLAFLGQIDLASLPQSGLPLPPVGMLYVFSDQESGDNNPHWLGLYTEGGQLHPHPVPEPESFADENQDEPFGQLAIVRATASVSLPSPLDNLVRVADNDADAYGELVQAFLHDSRQKEPTSRMFGYADGHGDPVGQTDRELIICVQSFFANKRAFMNFWDAGSMTLTAARAPLQRGEIVDTRATLFSH